MEFRGLGLRFIVFCLAVPAMLIPFIFTKISSQTPVTGLNTVRPAFSKIRIAEHAGKSLRPAPDGMRIETTISRAGSAGAWVGSSPLLDANPKLLEAGSNPLNEFVNGVKNGDRGLVRGVFVEDVLALPVIQQPARNNAYVSPEWGEVTEFNSARRNGVTGLLAHNYLSGADFYSLKVGQEILIVYGDGSLRRYEIQSIDQYQKLNPASLQSDLIQLSNGERVSTSQVFNKFYKGEHKVTLQTCLEKDGIMNWGLTFWTAIPVP